ncbi:hypothetical protein [Demequina sp.]|uniref:hypothetical protein n=1 Tax=Demequina sp. TaxID=2050685 RepID=UPI003A851077
MIDSTLGTARWQRLTIALAVVVAITAVWPAPAHAADTATLARQETAAAAPLAQAASTGLPAAHRGDAWVASGRVDFRVSASPSAAVQVTAYRDARVWATGAVKGGWREFKVAGMYAWAPAKHITTTKPGWDPVRVVVTKSTLDLRYFPGTNSSVELTVKAGTRAIFTGVARSGWWEVKVGNTWAWTPSQYISVNGYYSANKVLDVAKSQVGYREPSWRNNKYNSWINGNNAWCSVFVSWVFAHADYAAGVPKRKHFDDYVADLRRAGVLDTSPRGSEMRKGDVVLIDWAPRNGPTHTGIVDRVDGNYVWLVEGNTTSGTGSSTRGVFYRKRALADVYAWFRPTDYAMATR